VTARPSLADELATQLSPLESALGGCARPAGELDEISAMAIWELLAYVMGERFAPRPWEVVRWNAPRRASARRWGERELARKTLGATGRDSLTTPRCLAKYVARWEALR